MGSRYDDEGNVINQNHKAEAEVVAELASDLAKVEPLAIENTGPHMALMLAVPKGKTLIDTREVIETAEGKPWRKTGAVQMHDLDSFIAYLQRHKTESLIVYMDVSGAGPKAVAILNDHSEKDAGFRDFSVGYIPQMSNEWSKWTGNSGALMGMREFGEFIEDHIIDVMDPKAAGGSTRALMEKIGIRAGDASTLQGLAKEFHVNVNNTVKEARNLQTGELQLIFDESHSDKGGKPIKVPGGFVITIPVFFGGELFSVVARLRYRVNQGKVQWVYHLYRTDLVMKLVVEEMVKKIRDEVGCLVLFGRS